MSRRFSSASLGALGSLVALIVSSRAHAGPEIALREFAGGQVKKGVVTIGMGGDGATTGNYGLVYRDAGTAIVDVGAVRYRDSGDLFTFSAVGFTTPTFWDDAALYVIALSQHADNVRVWDDTPVSTRKPPSVGDLSDSAVFVKFAKPLSRSWSLGFLTSFEFSDATLLPDSGAAAIRYSTSYLPSGGVGLHWHPDDHWQAGVRVILNHDMETRTQGSSSETALFRSYEYRLGGAYAPWPGALIDVGGTVLDRSDGLEKTRSVIVNPNLGVQVPLLPRHVWIRAGLDETTWTAGASFALGPFKLDVAYLYGLALARIGDQFGTQNASFISTLGFDYDEYLGLRKKKE